MSRPQRRYLYLTLHSVLPLGVAALIYVYLRGFLFRTNIFYKAANTYQYTQVSEFFKFNLPDGLWLYSFISTLYLIWGNDEKNYGLLWQVCVVAASIISELLQKSHIIYGTYDIIDILTYLMFSLRIIPKLYILFKSKISSLL